MRGMSLHAVSRGVTGTLIQNIEIDGRHHIATDEPASLGGSGAAPSPHELLPAALAGCISTHIVMYARTKDWELGDVSVDVDYDHRAAPRRFAVQIEIGAELDADQIARVHRVALTCPVRRALEGAAVFEETIFAGSDRRCTVAV
jgi:putative redox protein